MAKEPPPPDFVLRGHLEAVNSVCFFTDQTGSSSIASGAVDGELRVWDLSTRRSSTTVKAHQQSILSVGHIAQHNILLTCGRDEVTRLWNLEEGSASGLQNPVATLPTGAKHFCNASSNQSHLVATPSLVESDVLIWDLRSQSVVTTIAFGAEKGILSFIQFAPVASAIVADDSAASAGGDGDGGSGSGSGGEGIEFPLFAAHEDGSISIADLRTSRVICNSCIHDDKEPLLTFDVSSNAKSIVTGGANNKIHRADVSLETEGGITKRDFAELTECGTSSIKMRSDGRIIASGHWDGTVRLFDTKKLKPLAVLRYHRESVFGIDFGPSGSFASASKEGNIAVWSLYADKMKKKEEKEA